MPRTIWKFPLDVTDEQLVSMPAVAEILTVQAQGDQPYLWAMVDPAQPRQFREIVTRGTGHPVPDRPGTYVGTYQLHGGGLIYHVFARD
jgi:hypothetical protein